MEDEGILRKTAVDFSERNEIIQTIIIAIIAFVVPTFLAQIIQTIFGEESVIASNSQLIVGSTVNMFLIISAINLKGWKKIIPIITMPSISTVLSGYVFKSASVYMVYMIPAIWLGNFVLILAYKAIMIDQNRNYFFAGIIGIIVKVAIIFGCFNFLKLIGIFPEKIVSTLQTAMSTTQLITATVGAIIAFAVYKIELKCKQK